MLVPDFLSSASTRFPDKPALLSGDLLISYRRFQLDVEAVARALAASGIVAGQSVGIFINQSASHWCVLLALLRLGAVSVSLTSRHQAEIQALPDLSFIVCSERDQPDCHETIRLIKINANWLSTPSNRGVRLPPPEEAEHHFGRICFTSGTSGKPKAVHLDAATLKRRLSKTAERSHLDAKSVLWCGIGPDSAYGFTAPVAAWLVGGSVCFATKPDKAYEDLTKSNVNVIIASPAALNSVLQESRGGAPTRLSGPVIVAGGRLSVRLRDLLLEKFCSEVLIAYGSSETGGITLADALVLDQHPGAIGSPFPDVQVQIVDANGRTLPPGTPGRLRAKTSSTAPGYLNDRVATALHFAEGWFYPGDIAQISYEGLIILLGREADTLNIGGVKLSATEIDEAARSQVGVEDACAIVLPDRGEGVRLAIAVAGQMDAIRSLPPQLRATMPGLPPFSVVPVSLVPRNSMGKVNREEFAQEIAELLHNPEAAAAVSGFSIIQD
ncbi:class I adenylate-forming enzyme family protein [Microvirga yunnanensis]|uniref:class I adenylate-forming enzyme family protein n=1 Tax=Microvirga yunnanensis TaxID=2953740 RepID=UPI0021C7FD6E|nr:class I adenylate-forming enzyme family protein [Microvirga sp. HBU65207]